MNGSDSIRLKASGRLEPPQKGVEIDFERSLVLPPMRDHALTRIQDWESFEGVLLGLWVGSDLTRSVLGSAVVVGPGIAISAHHIIEGRESELLAGVIDIIAFGITTDGLQLWKVAHITRVDNTDLVLLGLTYASSIRPQAVFRMSTLTTRLPSLGERVFIAGTRPESEISVDTHGEVKLDVSVIVCTGVITGIYIEKRDTAVLPFPVLEVRAAALGGMSGGPVFDQFGKLVGLLTSSFETEYGDGPAYVSLLYPALVKPVLGGWPGSLDVSGKSLLELHAAGSCYVDEPRALEVHVDELDPTKNVCSYRSWSKYPFDPAPAFGKAGNPSEIAAQFVRLHVESVDLHNPDRHAFLVRSVVSPFGRPELAEYGAAAVVEEALLLQHLDELKAEIEALKRVRIRERGSSCE